MNTVKSFDKKTGRTYVYEITSNKWDPVNKRGVPTRRCIGHIDEETGEVVPNSPRGRKRKEQQTQNPSDKGTEQAVQSAEPDYKAMYLTAAKQLNEKNHELEKLMRENKTLQETAAHLQAVLESIHNMTALS